MAHYHNLFDVHWFYFQAIAKLFKSHEIDQAVVCFGATTYTVKEAFVINIPHVTPGHFVQHHSVDHEKLTEKSIV